MHRSLKRLALAVSLVLAFVLAGYPEQKQKRKPRKGEEPVTQTLELPKEPPPAVTAETEKLSFRVTPLSGKGLLSQQVRDALRWLLRQERAVARLRAFVAGSGDMRRVQAIVSEMFTERRLALPALTVVQVGSLPLEGAQVEIEAVGIDRKAVNPNGLAFLSAQGAAVEKPLAPMAPLVEQSVERVRAVLNAAGLWPRDVISATCYLSSLDELAAVRQRVAAEFPGAAFNILQRTREPSRSVAECEIVARLKKAPAQPMELAAGSQAALVGARRVVLTGEQLAFGYDEPAARLAFERLGKTLEQAGTSFRAVAMAHVYSLSRPIAGLVEKVQTGYYDRSRPPAATMLAFEGLPSLDASFGLDVIAVLPDNVGRVARPAPDRQVRLSFRPSRRLGRGSGGPPHQ